MQNLDLIIDEFKDLGLMDELVKGAIKSGFVHPTDIQVETISKIFSGKDFLIEAQTGSGKTACFVWPILQTISKDDLKERNILALILTPTRELAMQITGTFYRLGEFLPKKVEVLTIIGGESIEEQKKSLSHGVDVVVATPGRLLDLLDKKVLSLSHIQFLVLDEADKILDLGFAQELDSVLKELSVKRQNLFFSATYPEKVLGIASKISQNAIHLKIDNVTPTVENIHQRVIQVNRENRGMLLRHLIQTEKWNNAIIFVSSKTLAHNLAIKLQKNNISVGALHGDLSQAERNKALSDFKERKLDFLVATDVAARGIDINKLSLVINFDLPRSPADYIHRIGRTGRAGEKGLAISFIGHEDQEHFKLIEKRAAIKLTREEVPGFTLTGDATKVIKGQAPVKGKRKSKKDKARELLALNQKDK